MKPGIAKSKTLRKQGLFLSMVLVVALTTIADASRVKLYGRIEELCQSPGARLPVMLPALKPKMDTREMDAREPLKGRASATTEKAEVKAATYPLDWAGTWSGILKVWTAQFDPSRWSFDAQEASQEQQLLKPGTSGQVSFTFSLDNSRKIELEPTQVVFSAPMSKQRSARLMQQAQEMMPGLKEMLDSAQGGALMGQVMQSLPYIYALHLGDLNYGVGVTGNSLNSRTLKNDVKVVAPGALEQQIVTYNEDVSKATGKKKYGYSETVVRFTRLNQGQLYVQAASVDYDRNGHFEDKVVLYGTINKGSPAGNSMPDFFGLGNGYNSNRGN